jgi:hypothetical protein
MNRDGSAIAARQARTFYPERYHTTFEAGRPCATLGTLSVLLPVMQDFPVASPRQHGQEGIAVPKNQAVALITTYSGKEANRTLPEAT